MANKKEEEKRKLIIGKPMLEELPKTARRLNDQRLYFNGYKIWTRVLRRFTCLAGLSAGV